MSTPFTPMPYARDLAAALLLRERRQSARRAACAKRAVEGVAVRGAVEVVHVHDVDARRCRRRAAAVGERAQDAVARVVVGLHERAGRRRSRAASAGALRVRRAAAGRPWWTAGTRRRGTLAQRGAETALGQPVAVVRRGVEVADAGLPRAVDGPRVRVLVAHRRERGCRAARRRGRPRQPRPRLCSCAPITGCTLTC